MLFKSILPEGEELVLEANVLNRDIGFIAKGMTVKVKLATFQEFGTIDGEVVDISADAIADEKLGLIFSVKDKLNQQFIEVNGEKIDLVPGMATTADIVTRQKSILSFLIEPVEGNPLVKSHSIASDREAEGKSATPDSRTSHFTVSNHSRCRGKSSRIS